MRLSLIVVFLFPLTGFAQKYEDYIFRATDAIEKGDNIRAAAVYDSIFAKFEAYDGDLYNAACANSLIGNLEKAVKFLQRAYEKGYDDFDWMYYDKDLDPIRNHPGYIAIEKKYRPASVIYYFEILRELSAGNNINIIECGKRISIHEELMSRYSFDEINERVGGNLRLTSDSLIDFSTNTLRFCKGNFENSRDAMNILRGLSLDELSLQDCSGGLKMVNIKVNLLEIFELNPDKSQIRNLTLDSVIVNGNVSITSNGHQFHCRNSTFNLSKREDEEYDFGMRGNLRYEFTEIKNTTINVTRESPFLYPTDITFLGKRLVIVDSKFNQSTRLAGEVEEVLEIHDTHFPPLVDITRFNLPDFNCYFPFEQLHKSQLVKMGYNDDDDGFYIKGDSHGDYSDVLLFDELTGLHKRLYDNYRARADIASANNVYVLMKDLEITHLKTMEHRTSEETIRLRLNQLMGFYTDHATSPGKALIISFYIILAFGVFYCFFPSDWDKTSKGQIISDFKIFIEKNEHGYVRPFFKMMKGLLMSLLNAVALSMNAFITLGFGNIPTTGIARYMCIVQGMLGWFLLSLFTVALLNQVLL